MATISEDCRYTALLKHVDHEEWGTFVLGACYVTEKHTGEDQATTLVGLIEAKRRGTDQNEFKWRTLLWIIGAEADFIERLERATEQPNAVAHSGALRRDPRDVERGGDWEAFGLGYEPAVVGVGSRSWRAGRIAWLLFDYSLAPRT